MKLVVFILLILACTLGITYAQRRNCPTFCPLNYDPKCGYNGNCYRQFSNTCDLSSYNCRSPRDFRPVDIRLCREASARRGGLRAC